MARVNNTIDKFGRQRVSAKVQLIRGAPGIGFKLTTDNQYDIGGKSLTNVANPIKKNDATTKEYVDQEINQIRKNTVSVINNIVAAHINKKMIVLESKLIQMIRQLEKQLNVKIFID